MFATPNPTAEEPVVKVAGGLMSVSRGLEALGLDAKLTWLAVADGPCLRIETPNEAIILPIDDGKAMVSELIAAMTMCAVAPVGDPGGHAAAALAMGYTAVPR